jgi:hypothetical protein
MTILYRFLGALSGLFQGLKQFRRGLVPAQAYLIVPCVLAFYLVSLLLQNQAAVGDPDHPRVVTLTEIVRGDVPVNSIVRVQGRLSADTGIRKDCKDNNVYPVLQSGPGAPGVLTKISAQRPSVAGTVGAITGVLRPLSTEFLRDIRAINEDTESDVRVSPRFLLVHGAAAIGIQRARGTLESVRLGAAVLLGVIALSLVVSGPVFLRTAARPTPIAEPFAAYEQPLIQASGTFQRDFSLRGRRAFVPVYTTDAFSEGSHSFVGAVPAAGEGKATFLPFGMFGLIGGLITLVLIPLCQALFTPDRTTESGRISFGRRSENDLTWGVAYFGLRAYPALRVRYEHVGSARSVTLLTETEADRERLAATLLSDPPTREPEFAL